MSTLGKFEVLKTLGTGAFSKVKLARHTETNQMSALKIMKRDDSISDSFIQIVINEIDTMKNLDHENIIKLLDFSDSDKLIKEDGTSKDVFYMALELASGGELFDYIAQTGKFSEPVARHYFHQLIDALEYLHDKGISHRDIKPENVLLSDEFKLKVADFGFSSSKPINETRRGTESYMAPEINLSKPYAGPVVDLFAAAIILFIMITQHPPFGKAVPTDPHYKLVCANRLDLFWKFHSRSKEGGLGFFSEEFISLMSCMLQLDPNHRPSISEIKSHPWYNGEIATVEEVKEEFAKRKAMLDGQAIDNDQPEPTAQPSPNVFQQHVAHRGLDDKEEESKLPTLKRTAKAYLDGYGKVTQFFSTANVDKLFDTLACYAEANTSDFKFAPNSYKCKLSILKDDQKVDLTARILSVGDGGKHCIEFTKDSGDVMVYNELFNKAREFFGGLVNATQ